MLSRCDQSEVPLLRSSLLFASAILLIPLAFPLLTWRVMTAGDLGQFHLPMRFIYQQALQRGDTFLWSPALGSGVYLHAEGQSGMTHPLHLLLYGTLPLTAAFNLEMLASYLFATAGTWLLLRRLGITREAALAGALLFAFSGFNVLHLNHLNMVAVIAHAPWLLWGADLVLTGTWSRTRALGFATAAAALGSAILVGFPQAVWLDGVALAWLVAFRLATGTAWYRVPALAAALVAGVLLGGVQLLPTLDAVRSSLRATTTMAFRVSYSLHPANLVQLVSPYALQARIYAPVPGEHFMHEFGVYNGAISTVALCWIALRWRELTNRRLVLGFLALAILALSLALGRYAGLYTLLTHLPGVSSIRAPTRHIALLHLALGGLVALVLEDLSTVERLPWRRLALLAVPVMLSALVAVAVVGVTRHGSATIGGVAMSGVGPALVGTAFVAATALLFGMAARGRRWAIPVLLVLAAVDLFWWGTRYVYAQPPVPLESVVPGGGRPPAALDGELIHPSAMRNDMNLYPMIGLRSSTVYLGLIRSSVLDPHRPVAQRIAGVKWTWTSIGWSSLAGTMPRARLVTDWRVVEDATAAVESIDISRTALLDRPVAVPLSPPGLAEVLIDRPGLLAVQTTAASDQLLVLTERFHAGWRVDLDGRTRAAALPVYGDYLACIVPAGTHRVTFVFEPASARWGSWMTIAGIVMTAGGALSVLRHRGFLNASISSPRRM